VIGPKGRSRLNRVSNLLNGDRKWDETLVRRTFLPIDVEVTLRIKTSSSLPEDMVACQHERSDIFLVKSAYRVGLQLAQQDRMTATSSLDPLGDKSM
jgi:predicted pyridoxine 5'-phosphate oxidase superfamily flavin-nucleotide-binding protein